MLQLQRIKVAFHAAWTEVLAFGSLGQLGKGTGFFPVGRSCFWWLQMLLQGVLKDVVLATSGS